VLCGIPGKHAVLEVFMNTVTKTWLWLSIATTGIGAVLLYPIGSATMNVLFIVIKIGMAAGIILLLIGNSKGFPVWCIFSAGAVVMTILKWHEAGQVTVLFITAIAVDILMPAVACLLKKQK
jgi:hypothetical protein